ASAMTYLQEQGAVAIGQTSWGPTGFCAVQGINVAEKLKQQLEQRNVACANLEVLVVSARNSGGEVLA
ncbi:MAG: GHMP kinase, partial [Methyloprofundus sp.]|nr:GHMP kinase [Methyloprofundus sp.]